MSWPAATLEELCHFIKNGKSIQQSKEISGLPITRIETIANQSIDMSRVGYAGISVESAGDFLLEAGDILFSHINSLEHLGKAAIYKGSPEKLVHGMNLLNLRPDQSKVDCGYLLRALRAPVTKAKLLRIANKSVNQASIAAGNLKKIEIPLPPLPEQRRIVAILDKADALRAKRREAIAKFDQLLQSVFLEIFGDPVMNPKGWPLISFADVGQWKSGATPSKSKPAYWEGSFPWVSPKDMKVSLITDAQDHVSDLAFESTNLKRIEPGHLLIVVRGMILAHSFPTAVNAVPVAINQDMKAIAPIQDLDIIYLQAAVDSLKARILSVVSTAGHGTCRLDTRDASEVMVPVPPLEVQLAYKSIASKYTQLRGEALEQLKKLDSMFVAIQQKAFEGSL